LNFLPQRMRGHHPMIFFDALKHLVATV